MRRTGLNRVVAQAISPDGYEAKYSRAIADNVHAGACIWDIGANTGHYTVRFAQLAGQTGQVHAFEPSPPNLKALGEATRDWRNIHVHSLAVSDKAGELTFVQGTDAIGATSRIAAGGAGDEDESTSNAEQIFRVRSQTGDGILAAGIAPAPDLVKIDVEGHELAVLSGMANLLSRQKLRHVFVEVHFNLLRQAGIADGPARIESLLTDAGFDVRWTDPSHIHACRLVR